MHSYNLKLLLQVSAFIILILNSCNTSKSNANVLKQTILQILANKNATVGVSLIANNGMDTIAINGNKHMPMQSVFKFHIALAVLAEIDKGKLAIDKKIEIKKNQLLPQDVWNPLRDDHPNGGTFTIKELIQYSVSHSDNLACDILIKLIGTPKTVEEYIKSNGIADIQITYNEKDMQAKWENMYQNWTTAIAASKTLELFYNNKNNLLSTNSYNFFWTTNKETSTGKNRIKSQLPSKTIIAHKTGYSGTNKATGITGAVNDIGIVFLPNGQYFILSVFVSQSKEDLATNEKIIADIAKAAYDYYSVQ
jgi:beta-lactamase class A